MYKYNKNETEEENTKIGERKEKMYEVKENRFSCEYEDGIKQNLKDVEAERLFLYE